MNGEQKPEGFKGQIKYVIPRPMLSDVAQHILVSGLYPTDLGWYPRARQHYRHREAGAEQNILIVCLKGKGWFEIEGKRRDLRKNQALLVPAGRAHSYGASPRDSWSIQWLHFVGDDAPYFLTLLREDFVLPIHTGLAPKIDRLFADAYEALADGFSQQSIICASQIVRHMLGLLFFSNKAFSPTTKARRFRNLDQVIQFMKLHIDSTLTIEQMAKEAGLSIAHFSRLFRQQVGFPPMEYFIHLKVQRACRFLAFTPLSVKEISSRLGYTDQYYFSRVFHKVMGHSPMAYRRDQSG